MDRIQELQNSIHMRHDQVTACKMSYRELADYIRQVNKILLDEVAKDSLSFEMYDKLSAYLILIDTSGQTWRLFLDGSWRQQRQAGEWVPGDPDLSDRKCQNGPGWLRLGVIAVILVLMAVGGIFWWNASSVTPIPSSSTLTVTSSPTITLPTVGPSPTTAVPTLSITPTTFTPSPTLSPTFIVSIPFTVTSTITPATPTPVFTFTFTPSITAIPASTPIPIPTPTTAPYGIIAYAVFDQITGLYNTYLRAWPDKQVIQQISKVGQPAAQLFGSKLAFRSWDGSRQGILIFDRQTQQEVEVTGPTQAIHPGLSSSGRLVYTANDQPDQKWHLYVNGQMLQIDGSVGAPAWVDEKQLVFDGCITNTGCGIFVISDDGSGLRRLTDSGNFSHRDPAPSPDGKQIIFMSNQNGNNWDIYRISVNASPEIIPERLTTSPSQDVHPAWSPDGRWIAFVSNKGTNWVMQMIPAEGPAHPQELFTLEGSLTGFVVAGPGKQDELVEGQISWFQ